MEPSEANKLEQKVDYYLSEVFCAGNFKSDDQILEFKDYLIEETEALRKYNLSLEDAFFIATRRMGDRKMLEGEYAKIGFSISCLRNMNVAIGLLLFFQSTMFVILFLRNFFSLSFSISFPLWLVVSGLLIWMFSWFYKKYTNLFCRLINLPLVIVFSMLLLLQLFYTQEFNSLQEFYLKGFNFFKTYLIYLVLIISQLLLSRKIGNNMIAGNKNYTY